MSKKSNDQGRAYEFAYLNTLHEEISNTGPQKLRKTQVTKLLKMRGIL